MKEEFSHYANVHGWLQMSALLFTSYFVNKFLFNKDFESLEIGVHHGKYFIGIENLTPLNCRAVAIDVFDSQSLNIDNSGCGNYEAFSNNVKEFCLNPSRVNAISMDSLDIDPFVLGVNRFGIISIDGGHTERHTVSDLAKAELLMSPDGIVILDDILNQDWTGVVSGACNYFASQNGRLVPFAVGFNKLFCCHFSRVNHIKEILSSDRDELAKIKIKINKTTTFVGHEIFSLKGL